jgi:hypothetical protein
MANRIAWDQVNSGFGRALEAKTTISGKVHHEQKDRISNPNSEKVVAEPGQGMSIFFERRTNFCRKVSRSAVRETRLTCAALGCRHFAVAPGLAFDHAALFEANFSF